MMGGAVAVAALFFVAVMAIISYRSAYLKTQEVRIEAAQFMQDRAALIGKVTLLEEAVARTERFASKLEAASGAGRSGRVGEGPVAEHEALPETPSTAFTKLESETWKSPFSGALSKDLLLSLDKISERTGRVEEQLHSLFSKQQDKLYFWASLPSIWPARGWITSVFGANRSWGGDGRLHEGIDIAGPRGTPVIAPSDGIVTYTGYRRGYGNTLMIDHGYGLSTLYGHCSALYVNEGQQVKRGALIAAIGNTGRSTGPHLHYEIRVDGIPVNPMLYLGDKM